jgi:hypothetical protein
LDNELQRQVTELLKIAKKQKLDIAVKFIDGFIIKQLAIEDKQKKKGKKK